MLAFAVQRELIAANPMRDIEKERRDDRVVRALTVDRVRELRHLLDPTTRRKPNARGPNRDLPEIVDFILGTGCRIGETLAVRWRDLSLDVNPPTVDVCGTLIEPRGRYVEALVRQPMPKNDEDRTLILPNHVIDMLRERRKRTKWRRLDDPVFASSASGGWIWPSNIRTRLRAATANVDGLSATTPHTLRRTVGTLVAHERGTDAAREQLGHSDGSVTATFYVAKRSTAPDLRDVLDKFFTPPDSSSAAIGTSKR